MTTEIMSLDDAKRSGAIALFGEKYGSEVRVVSIGDNFDRELCGGTHVPSTGHLGRVTVLSEGSIGSGVRRIDALVGDGAYAFQAKEHALVSQLSSMLGGRPDELASRVESMMGRLREAEKELQKIREQQALAEAALLAQNARKIGKFTCVVAPVGALGSADDLRAMATDIRERLGNDGPVLVALAGVINGKPMVTVATNDLARQHSARAGQFVRRAAKILGGGGGGRDDLAQGGGSNPEAIEDALNDVNSQIQEL